MKSFFDFRIIGCGSFITVLYSNRIGGRQWLARLDWAGEDDLGGLIKDACHSWSAHRQSVGQPVSRMRARVSAKKTARGFYGLPMALMPWQWAIGIKSFLAK